MSWINPVTNFIASIQTYITVGLGATTLVAGIGWYTTGLKLDTARQEVKTCAAERKADKESYRAAQEAAAKKSTQEALNKERENAKQAQKSDARYAELRSKYDASILRYKQLQTNKRPAAEINLSSTSSSTDGSYSYSDSSTISITIKDAGICAENTARLQAVQEWATGPAFKSKE